MITERTLRQWRRDALRNKHNPLYIKANNDKGEELNIAIIKEQEYCNRILRLTQELLDQNLLRRKS
jgi:hypothetical protein